MLVYPQLSTGTLAQYPLRKTLLKRTIINDCLDSRTVKLADVSGSSVHWQLNYSGLTEAEWNSIKGLFLNAEGRLQTFLFLDPTDNLLRFSETLSSTAWEKDGLLTLTAGISDPLGTTRASRLVNTAAVNQKISQTVPAAGWFQYVFSVYVRSSSAGAVTVRQRSADGEALQSYSVGSDWRRVQVSGAIEGAAEEIEFELAIPAGGAIETFGFQVEAQPQPSAYKKTNSQAGVYAATRFEEDVLSPIAVGLNDYAVQIQLVSKAGN